MADKSFRLQEDQRGLGENPKPKLRVPNNFKFQNAKHIASALIASVWIFGLHQELFGTLKM